MSYSQLRPLSIGEVLDGAFTLYRRQFASMFLTALLPQIPMMLLMSIYYLFMSSFANPAAGIDGAVAGIGALVLLPFAIVGTMTAVGGVTYQVARAYTGSPVDTNAAIRRGLQRSLPLLGASMIFGILVMFGFFAFIIGAVLVWIAGFAVAPAVVLERLGPTDAISRSWKLTKGAWGEVFLVMLISTMIAALPSFAVGAFGTLGAVVLAAGDPGKLVAAQMAAQVLGQLVRSLTIPFSVGATVLLYYDRRVRSEALDVQMMAESLPTAPHLETAAP